MNSLPPFWTATVAIGLLLVILANFPKVGMALLAVVVLGMLLNANTKGYI
jgi:hypothetical protein